MGPDNNQQDEQTAKDWFASVQDINAPPPLPPIEAAAPQSHRKLFVVAGCIVLLLVVAGASFATWKMWPIGPVCLDTTDYKQLTGKEADPQLSSQAAFYTASGTYRNGTNDFSSQTSADSMNDSIKRIGNFYKTKSDTKSFIITIRSDYGPGDTKEASIQRGEALQQSLIAAGVAPRAITSIDPTEIPLDDELSATSEELTRATAYVAVTSQTSCR